MSTQIQELYLDGEKLYVALEVFENIDIPLSINQIKDLPPGAEPTGIVDDTIMASYLLKAYIKAMAKTTREALKELSPDEISFELNIGFVGKVNPIPVIVGGDLQGGIKITVSWKTMENNIAKKKKKLIVNKKGLR